MSSLNINCDEFGDTTGTINRTEKRSHSPPPDETREDEDLNTDAGYLDILGLDDQQTERRSSTGVVLGKREMYFLHVREHVEAYWPKQLDPERTREAIKKLRVTPYLAECLGPHLSEADSPTPVDLPANVEDLNGPRFQNLSKEEIFKQLLLRDQIHQQIMAINKVVSKVQDRTTNVHTQLLALAGLSQAEGTVTGSGTSVSKVQRTVSSSSASKSRGIAFAEPQCLYETVFEMSKDIEEVLPDLSQITSDKGILGQNLKKIANCFNDHLEQGSFLRHKNGYKQKALHGLRALQAKVFSELNQSGASVDEASIHTKNEELFFTHFTPGARAHEKDGTQPYLQVLFKSIGQCCERSDSLLPSPSKRNVRPEAPIPKTAKRPKRTMDFLFNKEGPWQPVIFDDTLTIPVEVKPGCRTSQGPQDLLDEARDQCISHLAKSVFVGFSFAKYGVPCHATGIIANMAALQVFQLRYECVGTPEAKLQLYQSDLVPLMTLKNFENWADSGFQKNDSKSMRKHFEAIKHKLFGESGTGGVDKNGIPKGFCILFNLMQASSKKLYGLTVHAKSELLDRQLGFGASAIVFLRARDDAGKQNSVIKLSRFGYAKEIEQERKILVSIGQVAPNKYLNLHLSAIASDSASIKIYFGTVPKRLPAIELSPAGTPGASIFVSSGACVGDGLQVVLEGITSALTHMHKHKICHCDVAPKNIILAKNPDGSNRAVLIDFSLSQEQGKSFSRFRGTANFVHGQLFLNFLCFQKPLSIHPRHDWVGLGFTLAYFANKCFCPWNIGGYPKSIKEPSDEDIVDLKNVMISRRDMAYSVIKNFDMSDDAGKANKLRREIKNLLNEDLEDDAYKLL